MNCINVHRTPSYSSTHVDTWSQRAWYTRVTSHPKVRERGSQCVWEREGGERERRREGGRRRRSEHPFLSPDPVTVHRPEGGSGAIGADYAAVQAVPGAEEGAEQTGERLGRLGRRRPRCRWWRDNEVPQVVGGGVAATQRGVGVSHQVVPACPERKVGGCMDFVLHGLRGHQATLELGYSPGAL